MIGSRARRRLTAALAALVTAAALASCSAHPGSAAVVDGRSVSMADVTAVQRDFTRIGQQISPQIAALNLAIAPSLATAARQAGAAASDQQARDYLVERAKQAGVDATDVQFAPASLAIGRAIIESEAMAQTPEGQKALTEWTASLGKADLMLNPRFGSVNDKLEIAGPSFPWLVQQSGSN